jgi:hypothetical protein
MIAIQTPKYQDHSEFVDRRCVLYLHAGEVYLQQINCLSGVAEINSTALILSQNKSSLER